MGHEYLNQTSYLPKALGRLLQDLGVGTDTRAAWRGVVTFINITKDAFFSTLVKKDASFFVGMTSIPEFRHRIPILTPEAPRVKSSPDTVGVSVLDLAGRDAPWFVRTQVPVIALQALRLIHNKIDLGCDALLGESGWDASLALWFGHVEIVAPLAADAAAPTASIDVERVQFAGVRGGDNGATPSIGGVHLAEVAV